MRFCPYCEGKYDDKLRQCPSCAASVRESEDTKKKPRREPAHTPVIPPQQPAAPAPPKPKMQVSRAVVFTYLGLFALSILGFLLFSTNAAVGLFFFCNLIAIPALTLWRLWKKRENSINAVLKILLSIVMVCAMLFGVLFLAIGSDDDESYPPEPPTLTQSS